MKKSKIPIIVATIIFIVLCIGLIVGLPFGTLSGFGWSTISFLCPIGALTTMIASKTLIPRAVVSIVLMIVAMFVLGRVFCGWMCPFPLWTRIKSFFYPSKTRKHLRAERDRAMRDIASYDLGIKDCCKACAAHSKGKAVCVRPEGPARFDSRHLVLAGAIVTTLIFGFPVFCVVCPVGLSFAAVLLLFRLFAFGDATVNLVIAIVLLVIEIFVLRKWCTVWCPMSGFMTLFSRFNKTFVPTIDNDTCLETTKGVACSRCASACPQDINLRHPAFGEHSLADCTRCRACVNACPTSSITMPPLPKRADKRKFFRSDGAIEYPTQERFVEAVKAAKKARKAASHKGARKTTSAAGVGAASTTSAAGMGTTGTTSAAGATSTVGATSAAGAIDSGENIDTP